MAKLCASCHQSDSNMMRGFLENIALKSKTLQMDLMGHKEVVKFNDHTELKNLNSFKEIRSYKGKGFRIHYVEKQGEAGSQGPPAESEDVVFVCEYSKGGIMTKLTSSVFKNVYEQN